MAGQDTSFHRTTTLNCKGRIVDLRTPRVMGILNITPDSFYDGGHYVEPKAALEKANQMLKEGATFIDVGGASSRPGAEAVSVKEEMSRVIPVIEALVDRFPDVLISIDTTQSAVANEAAEAGAVLINDISGGTADKDMIDVVASLGLPYICMHMQGNPTSMQDNPTYENVVYDVTKYFSERINTLKKAGVVDIILDPGFGFGKTVDHNYAMLQHLDHFGILGRPVLAGLSRKSMIYKVLNVSASESSNGSTALHMSCLERGASILRVHDVKEAMECVSLFEKMKVNTMNED